MSLPTRNISSNSPPQAEVTEVRITWRGEPWKSPQLELKINGEPVIIFAEQKRALVEVGALAYASESPEHPLPPIELNVAGSRQLFPGVLKSARLMRHWQRLQELSEEPDQDQADQLLEMGPFKLGR